jgi:cytochrome c oxidase assembly factor CtaG
MPLAGLVISLLAILGIYAIAMSRIADALSPARQRRHLAIFTLGVLLALAVFVPSPDLLGPDHRFAVNMGQFLVAADLAPLLLFGGIPAIMLQPLARWDALGRRLTSLVLLGCVSTAILLGWHFPVLFETASGNLATWLIKEGLVLVAGLAWWWPVAGPWSAWKPAHPVQLAYLFFMRIPISLLGIFMTFAETLIYTSRSFALEICAPSSLTDQVVGGLVMWTVGDLIVFAALSLVFYRWYRASEAAGAHGLA